jgi:hypothetical protein
MSGRFRICLLAATFVAVICLHDVVLACPTCKNGLDNDPAHSSMVQGYFFSIIFMMSMPFLILGGLGAYFYYEVHRARVAQSRAVSPASADLDSETADVVTENEAVPV